jgi:hypothetical protein
MRTPTYRQKQVVQEAARAAALARLSNCGSLVGDELPNSPPNYTMTARYSLRPFPADRIFDACIWVVCKPQLPAAWRLAMTTS